MTWLNEEPGWSQEFDYFNITATGEQAAFEYFEASGREFTEALCIDVIEGEYPGNDFRGARLNIDVEDANSYCGTRRLKDFEAIRPSKF